MSDINWKENAVCYFDGEQHFDNSEGLVQDGSGYTTSFYNAMNYDDFQLNEITTGDFIPASEIDTEQKYNDVVEVFGLLGFNANENTLHYNQLNTGATHYFASSDYGIDSVSKIEAFKRHCKGRQLTYHQIIAIGKLKRMILERQEPALMDDSSVQSKLSNIGNVLHNLSCLENDEDLQGELYNYASYLWDLSKSMVNEKSAHKITPDLTPEFTKASSNKYEREITDRQGNSATVDVYDVLKAFEVTCPATQHAVKKLLCSGLRGHKDLQTDLIEAKESIIRAIELN